MTTKPFIALAAAALVGAALTAPTPADAKMGLRLGFGFPLGSFVARPHAPSSQPAYHHAPHHAPRHYREAAPKPVYKPEKKIVRQQEDDEPVRRKVAKSGPKYEPKKVAKAEPKENKTESVSEASETPALVSNAASLAAQPDTPAVAAAPAAPAAPAPAAAATATAMATPAVSETKPVSATATPAPAPAPAPVVEAKPIKAETKAEAKAEKSDCRRFIPSAGVTISVRCAN